MRKPEYLSPSGIQLYLKDQEDFYRNYLSDNKRIREPQTTVMAVGSAFDAYAKSYLHEKLFGKGNDPKFEFEALFEAQVQSHCRDIAREHGRYVFYEYRESGSMNDLFLDLNQAINKPRFEIDVKGVVGGYREGIKRDFGDVVLLGKPDVFYINKFGASVVIDWKVNGFYSRSKVSPMKGYIQFKEKISGMNQYGHRGKHKDAILFNLNGVTINKMIYLEDVKPDWALQLSIYSWLCGGTIGEEFVVGIDQICCDPVNLVEWNGLMVPTIGIAQHRLRVRPTTQIKYYELAQDIWDRCHSGHFFKEMSLEESQSRCNILDQMTDKSEDDLFNEMTQPMKKHY